MRLRHAYTQAAEVQEWGLEIATRCFDETTCTVTELAESKQQEREFMDRILDCFVATYDTPDWCKHCLLRSHHRPPGSTWYVRLHPSPSPHGTLCLGESSPGPREHGSCL